MSTSDPNLQKVVLAIDIGGTKIAIAAVDSSNVVQKWIKQPAVRLADDPNGPTTALAEFISDFLEATGLSTAHIQGICVGVPGIFDTQTQQVASCPNLPVLDGVPLGLELADRLHLPVFVENDVNLIALGEHRWGRGRGIDDLACVFVGSGIGCALILGGQLYGGADGAAGEFGHTVIEPDGLSCTCGGRGCLEMYCSGKALSLQAPALNLPTGGSAQDMDGPWTVAQQVIAAAHGGHPDAREVVETAFYYLGLGVTNLVNILNVRMVILGGGIIEGWPTGLDTVRAIVRERARLLIRDRVQIERPAMGNAASTAGALLLIQSKTTSIDDASASSDKRLERNIQ